MKKKIIFFLYRSLGNGVLKGAQLLGVLTFGDS